MKVLIVGGAGYIGGYMTDLFLKDQNFDITLYDNLLYEKMFLKKVNFIFGDVRDKEKLSTIINDFDIVIWLAAIVGDGACAVDEKLTYEVNFEATKWLVDNYKGLIIFMSTCSVYGMNSNILDENAETNPLSLYARSKLEAEKYIKENSKAYLIFRLGTLYGIGDTISRLRFDLVVNVLTLKAVNGEEMTVFGGQQWRPVLHVRDVAHAVNYCIKNNVRGCYNLSESNVIISELAQKIAEIVPNTKIKYTKMKYEDLRDYKVENYKILSTGWKPTYDLFNGILDLSNVIRENRVVNGYDPMYSNEKYLSLINKKIAL